MKIFNRRKEKQVGAEKAEVEKVDDKPTTTTTTTSSSNKSVRSKIKLSKSKKDPVGKVGKDDDTSWWPTAAAEDDAASQYSLSTAGTKDKTEQKQVVYTHFGDSPKDLLEVTMAAKPRVEHSTDVVIKVEVRYFSKQCQKFPQPPKKDTHMQATIFIPIRHPR
jgi:hypothetical protein